MKYMLLMYADESKVPQTSEAFQAALPAWQTLTEEVEAAGVSVSNHWLSPTVEYGSVGIALCGRRHKSG